jgi:hypothetical protein
VTTVFFSRRDSMTETIRTRETNGHDAVSVYETAGDESFVRRETPLRIATTVVTPVDRIRWGPILAGLFASLTTLVVLGVLGLAVGLTSYDAGDPLSNFGLGAGIWSAVSTILAFLVGGWLAARTAATQGRNSGVLHGAMVWVVAIPLVLYLLSSGLGALLNTAGNVAATAAAAVAPAAAAIAEDAATPAAQATVQDVGASVQATVSAVGEQVTPETVENATETASSAAWGTLIALLLGLGAAAFGGLLGARQDRIDLQTA